jgi:hypothetical protein
VRTTASKNKDVTGAATPVVQLTGTGRVTVLRGCRAWQGTWTRDGLTTPTSFTGGGGEALTADPAGSVWVLLVASGQAVTVR